jgi:type 1 fimbria pilin
MDAFSSSADQVSAPATRALAVTPSDTVALVDIPKALYVGTAGDIVMRGVNASADTLWKAVPAGAILPFRAQYVRATGTTAADMLVLY